MVHALASHLSKEHVILCKEGYTFWAYSSYTKWYGEAVNYCIKKNIPLENIFEVINLDGSSYYFVRSFERYCLDPISIQ